jgi:hypothetical protein
LQQAAQQTETAIDAAAEQQLASFLQYICPPPEGLDLQLSPGVPPHPVAARPAPRK